MPLFDAIAGQLNDGGFEPGAFGDFLAGGLAGETDFAIAGAIAGEEGFGTAPLEEVLSGLPVLGNILADALAADGVETSGLRGLPLLSELLSPGGDSEAPSLFEALQLAAGQLQNAGGGGELPSDAEGLLALLPELGGGDNPLASTLQDVFATLASGDSEGLQELIDALSTQLSA